MQNPAVKRITAIFAALVIAAVLTPARAADYIKKATWRESMIASREAIMAQKAKAPTPKKRRRRRGDPNAPLWAFLQKNFTSETDVREMAWEKEDHIWTADWKPGTSAPSLAKRYVAVARKLSPKHAEPAAKLLTGAKDAAGLAKVRNVYLQARLHHVAMTRINKLNLSGMKTMVALLAKRDAKVSKHIAKLDALQARATAMSASTPSDQAIGTLESDAKALRYEALVKDNPLMDFEKLLFVKRFKYQSNHYYTDFINGCSKFGGNLCILDLKSGDVIDLIPEMKEGIFGRFDLHFNADKLVFAWKKERDEGFRIYEVPIDPKTGKRAGAVRQVLQAPANEKDIQEKYRKGYHHGTDDMDPCYLPDGGIVFISSRCMYGILCDGPDIFCTTLLYRMDADGKNLQKLTNSAVSEATPSILNDGRIMYTRWE